MIVYSFKLNNLYKLKKSGIQKFQLGTVQFDCQLLSVHYERP